MNQQQPAHPGTVDELLSILANQHCRATLAYFQDIEDVASVSTLADEINKQDHGGAEQVAHQLHHSVLPRLADAGAIDYDPRSKTARYRGHAELESLLDGIAACAPAAGD